MRPSSFAAILVLASAAPAQQGGKPDSDLRVLAMDHLESKGITAWIVGAASGERSLRLARLGAAARTRLRNRPMRNVLLDASAKRAFILIEQGSAFGLEQIDLDGDAAPVLVASDLQMEEPVLGRSGDHVLLLTKETVLSVDTSGGVSPLFRRDDPGIAEIAMNEKRTALSSVRAGQIEIVSSDGTLLGGLGRGHSPAFLENADLAFVREWPDPAQSGGRARSLSSEIVIAETAALEVPGRPILTLSGRITGLRSSGDRTLLFHHSPGERDGRFWLLHLETGVIRPMSPEDFGALRAAASWTATRPAGGVDSTGPALPEPETDFSGFFSTDDAGNEHRTAYEESGFDDARVPDEAWIHRGLLERFLEGVQWPFPRQAAYEPFIAADDAPLRPFSSLPHRGVDLGSRLMHVSTGSVAFHAAGTLAYPLHRGGHVWFGKTASVRDPGPSGAPFGNRRYAILQEVELRDSSYVLRVHIAYEHVRPFSDDGGSVEQQSEPDAFLVTGDEPIGQLQPLADAVPSGGWITSDPRLRAAGIAKGNHVHLGIGGIYRSFNGSADRADRKLRWYEERLIPALTRSLRPR